MKDYDSDNLFLTLAFQDLVKDKVMRQVMGMKMLTDGNKNNDLTGFMLIEDTNNMIVPKVESMNDSFVL